MGEQTQAPFDIVLNALSTQSGGSLTKVTSDHVNVNQDYTVKTIEEDTIQDDDDDDDDDEMITHNSNGHGLSNLVLGSIVGGGSLLLGALAYIFYVYFNSGATVGDKKATSYDSFDFADTFYATKIPRADEDLSID